MPGLLRLCRKKKLSDFIPNPLTFTSITAAVISTVYTSNTVTITGTNVAANFTCTGCTASINGGAYISSGTVPVGGTITLRLTASGAYNTLVTGSINVGGIIGTYSVTTGAQTIFLDTLVNTAVGKATISNNILTNTTTQTTNVIAAYCNTLSIPTDGNWYYWEGQIVSGATSSSHQVGCVYSNTFYGVAMVYCGYAVRYNSGNSSWYRVAVNTTTGAITSPTFIAGQGSGPLVLKPAIATSTGINYAQKIILDYAHHVWHPNIAASSGVIPYGSAFMTPTLTFA